MNKIEYFQIPFDECERGIKVIFNENDTLEIYDDSTDSYLSWHLTYDEVQGELYVCWTDRIKQKSFTKEAFEFERNLGYHLDSLKRLTKKRMKRLSEDYCKGKVTSFDVKQKMNGTFAFLNQGDTKQLQRYLTYKYIFTKDESLLHKDRSYNFKKKQKIYKEEKSYEKE